MAAHETGALRSQLVGGAMEEGRALKPKPDPLASAPAPRQHLPLPRWIRANAQYVTAAACLLYMTVSISMNVTHGAIAQFSSVPLTVAWFEMAFALLVLLIFLPKTLHFGKKQDVITWASTMPIFFSLAIGFNMLALRTTGLQATLVIRYVFPLITLMIESAFTEKLPIDIAGLLSLILSVVGVTLYINTSVNFNALGTVYIALNCVCVISEQLLQRWFVGVRPVDISFTGLMLINNGGGLVITGLMVLAFGEHHHWHTIAHWTGGEWAYVATGCALGTAIGWAALNATQYISATMILGAAGGDYNPRWRVLLLSELDAAPSWLARSPYAGAPMLAWLNHS